MSDTSAFGFGQFVPGFDFLQKLAKTASAPSAASSAVPGMSSWVAPTLSVEELDKRIQELKAVQFWLEQNGTALKATIQALEVQKMTLTTLQGMNVNMAELAKAFTAKMPEPSSAAPVPKPEPVPEPVASATVEPEEPPKRPAKNRSSQAKAAKPSAGSSVDPMQWWGSLTQQFQNIATAAMQDAAAQAIKAKAASAGLDAAAPAKSGGTRQSTASRTAARASRKLAGQTTGPSKAGAAKSRSPRR